MMRSSFSLSRPQQGVAITEVMISMAIGLILITGVVQLFISNQRTYTLTEGQARIQENARFAVSTLSRDLRMAGYMGCGNSNLQRSATGTPQIYVNNIVADPPANTAFGLGTTMNGINNAAADDLPDIIPGTDAITLSRASETSAQLTGNLGSENANIQLSSNPGGWEKNDILFITDCRHADIFRATNQINGEGTVTIAHANGSNIDNRLSKAYGEDAMVMSFLSSTYYVADSGRTNQAGEQIRSLYLIPINGVRVELIEGVSDMQITYGENTDGDVTGTADTYVTANAVTDWSNVVSVRLALLVDSIEDVTTEAQTYTFEGNNFVADDRRLRRSFTTTISLRNRTS
jgi:type IV pilus assembly protein PilW